MAKEDKGSEQPTGTEEQPSSAHPLDALLAVEEAEIQQLLEHPTTDTGETKEVALEEPAPKETAAPATEPAKGEPAKEAPAKEAAPTKEEPSVAEAKPKDKKARPYELLRETQKKLKEEQKKREELEAQLAKQTEAAPAAPAEEDPEITDPLTVVSKEIKEAKEEAKKTREQVERLQQSNEEQKINESIIRQETEFSAEHPDYKDARNYVLMTEREEYDRIGALDATADHLISTNLELVEKHLEMNPTDMLGNPIENEEDAARDLAFRILAEQRRQTLVGMALRTGRNVAQAVYEIAKTRGYQPKAKEEPKPAPAQETKPTPQERVQRAKEQEGATQSLSAMQSSGAARDRKVSRGDVLNMDQAELDALVSEMDKKDPFWDRGL